MSPPHLRVPLGDLLRHLLEVLLERVRQLQEERGGEGGEDVERHQPDAHADGVQELERRRSKFKRRALEHNPEQLSLIKNWKFAFLCETYIRTRIICQQVSFFQQHKELYVICKKKYYFFPRAPPCPSPGRRRPPS